VIEPINKKPSWKRRLWTELGLCKQDQVREEIGPDISVMSYKTGMSLGTESRVQVLCDNEPLIELHYTDRGRVEIEIQGVEAYGVRVRFSPLPNQTLTVLDSESHTVELD